MANKEALRDLQQRLAQRMQAARAQARPTSWLAVECAEQGLLFPLQQAGEIFPLGPLTPVPHARPWFMGVANLRGNLHGVVDLAAFLGLRGAPAGDAARDRQRLVALNPSTGLHCALLVDGLAGLRSADHLAAEPDPDAPRPAFAGTCWRDAEGRRWQEIRLSALAENEQFLAIAGF